MCGMTRLGSVVRALLLSMAILGGTDCERLSASQKEEAAEDEEGSFSARPKRPSEGSS